jgi:acyl-CoA synthetase (AMP-forming)/AMP-acid ligase II/3-hydroxymyristoyl/3-hydroxydecanoyl-(acyl carrier protein) dehydratase
MTPFPAHAPADPVAIGEDGPRTLSDLRAAAAAIARELARLGATRVVLACDDRFHFAAGLLGAWAARRQVILPPGTQPAALAALDGRDAVVLHDRPGQAGGQDLRAWVDTALPGEPSAPILAGLDEDVVLVTTSGSTGTPQSHPKTLGQLLDEVASHASLFSIGPGARILATAPPHHIYGLLWGILLPLRAGAAFLRHGALHLEAVVDAVVRLGATHIVSVPAHLRALADAAALPAVERVFSSSAPLPPETSRRLSEAGWPITEIFGSTETGGIAWRPASDGPWRAFPGVRVAFGEGGRLEVDGPFLHPREMRPYVTGDLARAVPGGFELLGRADRVVKSGGKRVSLAEIEERARGLAGVTDAAALGREADGIRGQEIWLAVAGEGITPEAVRRELGRWLDPLAMPRRIRVLAALPRGATGKPSHASLTAVFEGEPIVWTLEPESARRDADGGGRERLVLELVAPGNLGWFDGHFPGHPVLPGVVQLQLLVASRARSEWPALGPVRRLLRLKFKQVITPGARIILALVHERPAHTVHFELSVAGASCASGSVVFDPARPEDVP